VRQRDGRLLREVEGPFQRVNPFQGADGNTYRDLAGIQHLLDATGVDDARKRV